MTDAGQSAIEIQTQAATYFLQTQNGGFSSIIDNSGQNWLSFNNTPGSASSGEYRGLPNAVLGRRLSRRVHQRYVHRSSTAAR